MNTPKSNSIRGAWLPRAGRNAQNEETKAIIPLDEGNLGAAVPPETAGDFRSSKDRPDGSGQLSAVRNR